jgi:dolichyl-phosphate-mannose-protein mannosyltransferase
MITVAYLLGVAHPPGYPLYTLLAKLASLVPFGTVAWRVNLFSALTGGAATLLLCRGVICWTGDVAAGALAAGVFAFGPLVWPYAITAEVFALNNLFAAGLVYFAARASSERTAAGAVSPHTLNLAAL